MNSTQKYCLFALFLVVFAMMNVQTVGVFQLPPIANWSQTGNLRSGSLITLTSTSYDLDYGGILVSHLWYKNGVLIPSSNMPIITFTEILEEGQVSKPVTISLKVQDMDGEWSSLVTKVYTISQTSVTEYYLTDHLGSIRTTIDQTGTVIGFDDYDPFGNILPGRSYNAGTPNDLNKFTGHERDQEGGLDLDYMLARIYDSELGRFYSVDPLHYKFPAWSSYNYTFNNPLRFVDPDGRAADDPDNLAWMADWRSSIAAAFGPWTSAMANLFLVGSVEVTTETSSTKNGIQTTGGSVTATSTTTGSATEGYDTQKSVDAAVTYGVALDAGVASASVSSSSDGSTSLSLEVKGRGLELYSEADGSIGAKATIPTVLGPSIVLGGDSNGNALIGLQKVNIQNGVTTTTTTTLKKNPTVIINSTKKDVSNITKSFQLN
jgi:RHS repeat-associated protein